VTRAAEPRTFPLQPLTTAAGLNNHQLAAAVKANGTRIAQAATTGLTYSEADRWAVRVGQLVRHRRRRTATPPMATRRPQPDRQRLKEDHP
jgi:hypothetical protein